MENELNPLNAPSNTDRSKMAQKDTGMQPYEKKKAGEKMKEGSNTFLHYVSYVETLLPKVRGVVNAVLDICNALSGNPTNNYSGSGYYTSYGSYYNRNNYSQQTGSYGYSRPAAAGQKAPSNEILFMLEQGKTRGDAEAVYYSLLDLMEKQSYVTAGDLYSQCGIACDYTYENWGWYSLPPRPDIYKVPEGFVLRMPRERIINR